MIYERNRIRPAEATPATTKAKAWLEGVKTTFGIPNKAFFKSPQETVSAATRLIEKMQLDDDFFNNPIRGLYTLALANEWLLLNTVEQQPSVKKRSALMNLMKTVSTTETSTLSALVKRESSANLLIGKRFDPDNFPLANEDLLVAEQEIFQKLYEHPDMEKTAEYSAKLNAKGKNSLLYETRRFLENDDFVNVLVLPMTMQDMWSNQGTLGFIDTINGKDTVIVPCDINDNVLQHEAIHVLSYDISDGFFMLGLEEAWTESHTKNPKFYLGQRQVLNKIIQHDPLMSETLDKSLRSKTEQGKYELLNLLIYKYGLHGFLTIARMESGGSENYGMGIPPSEVLNELNKIEQRSLLRASRNFFLPFSL